MKRAKLILLDNPVIVTDEVIEGNRFIGNGVGYTRTNEDLKIISTNKQIDYNGIDFGVVDVKRLAAQKYPLWRSEWHEKDKYYGYINAFKDAQTINELQGKCYTEEDMIYAMKYALSYGYALRSTALNTKDLIENDFFKNEHHAKVLQSTSYSPKTFEVEIEETETTIKIIKKL